MSQPQRLPRSPLPGWHGAGTGSEVPREYNHRHVDASSRSGASPVRTLETFGFFCLKCGCRVASGTEKDTLLSGMTRSPGWAPPHTGRRGAPGRSPGPETAGRVSAGRGRAAGFGDLGRLGGVGSGIGPACHRAEVSALTPTPSPSPPARPVRSPGPRGGHSGNSA